MSDLDEETPLGAADLMAAALEMAAAGRSPRTAAEFCGVDLAEVESRCAAWGFAAILEFAHDGLLAHLLAHPDPRRLGETGALEGGAVLAAHRATRERLLFLAREPEGRAPAGSAAGSAAGLPRAATAGAGGVAVR